MFSSSSSSVLSSYSSWLSLFSSSFHISRLGGGVFSWSFDSECDGEESEEEELEEEFGVRGGISGSDNSLTWVLMEVLTG